MTISIATSFIAMTTFIPAASAMLTLSITARFKSSKPNHYDGFRHGCLNHSADKVAYMLMHPLQRSVNLTLAKNRSSNLLEEPVALVEHAGWG